MKQTHQHKADMDLTVERNTTEDTAEREKIPYFIRLEITSLTADIGRVYRIPVYITYMGIHKHFHVKICGIRLDTQGKPSALLEPIKQLCRKLVNVSRFPSYVFIARRAKHVYPAYTIGDEVFITTRGGGPIFRHVELAKVRRYLTEYLHRIHILGKDGKSDKLHARGVDTHTLGLRRPVLYLKKRVPGEEEFWAPVFLSGNRQAIYALAASARREVPISNGREVLEIRHMVAQALQKDNRLRDEYDLRPDRLTPSYWERLKTLLHSETELSVGGHTIPIYTTSHAPSRSQDLWLGLEIRPDENRFGLFPGRDLADVRARMTTDFARRGRLNSS